MIDNLVKKLVIMISIINIIYTIVKIIVLVNIKI